MDYMKKKTPIKGLLFYAIQGLDAPISLSLDGDDAYTMFRLVIRLFALFSVYRPSQRRVCGHDSIR